MVQHCALAMAKNKLNQPRGPLKESNAMLNTKIEGAKFDSQLQLCVKASELQSIEQILSSQIQALAVAALCLWPVLTLQAGDRLWPLATVPGQSHTVASADTALGDRPWPLATVIAGPGHRQGVELYSTARWSPLQAMIMC